MRVLFIHNVSVWGGSLRSMFETIRALAADPQIEEIHVILPKSDHSEKFKEFAIVHTFDAVPQYYTTEFGSYSGLRKLIVLREILALWRFKKDFKTFVNKKLEFDIIHFNEIVSFNMVSSSVRAAFPNAKIVCHVRSLQKRGKKPRFIVDQLNNNADSFITIDDCVKKTLSPELLDKVHIVPNIFADTVEDTSNFSRRSSDNLRVLYLGGLNWEKGADYTLQAAKIAKENNLSCIFTFAGIKSVEQTLFSKTFTSLLNLLKIRRTFKLSDIEDYIKNHELSDYVKLKGFIVNIGEFFSEHDVLIFPSRLNAPGRPSIEAMNYSLPSIIFCNFGSNIIVKEGCTGYNIANESVADLVEKLSLLSLNPTLLSELRSNCKKYSKDVFSASLHRERILQVYNQLLN